MLIAKLTSKTVAKISPYFSMQNLALVPALA